jgi:hypothetical protein
MRVLEHLEGRWLECKLDAGDFGEAQEAVFDLGAELGVGGFVGGGRGEGEGGEEAWRDAGDVGAGGFGVWSEGGGADEAEVDDVAAENGVVAVAEGGLERGGGHGAVVSVWSWVQPLTWGRALSRQAVWR